MKTIGVLTSGGDWPGMNAAVRGVLRAAFHHGLSVCGIRQGYKGLLHEDIVPMKPYMAGGIIHSLPWRCTILKNGQMSGI